MVVQLWEIVKDFGISQEIQYLCQFEEIEVEVADLCAQDEITSVASQVACQRTYFLLDQVLQRLFLLFSITILTQE